MGKEEQGKERICAGNQARDANWDGCDCVCRRPGYSEKGSSHTGVLLCSQLQLPNDTLCARSEVLAQVTGLLPPPWEAGKESPAPARLSSCWYRHAWSEAADPRWLCLSSIETECLLLQEQVGEGRVE